jgi:hypothetical protein
LGTRSTNSQRTSIPQVIRHQPGGRSVSLNATVSHQAALTRFESGRSGSLKSWKRARPHVMFPGAGSETRVLRLHKQPGTTNNKLELAWYNSRISRTCGSLYFHGNSRLGSPTSALGRNTTCFSPNVQLNPSGGRRDIALFRPGTMPKAGIDGPHRHPSVGDRRTSGPQSSSAPRSWTRNDTA